MGNLLVLLMIAGGIGVSVRSMIRNKKAGKSISCGQDCRHCGGCCHGRS